ncbi:MAG: spermidine/putrescine ABC transporter permease [Gammaproteobacteria bacterium GWE2_37_16]|nr:MAG: spermidine/putrescine ABC transporter permease [Gammaproteobacteria bacterium GWE2_37_16]
MKNNSSFKKICVTVVWSWLFIFAMVPVLLTLITSFLTADSSSLVVFKPTLQNYTQLFNSAYLKILLQSLYLATSCTLLCLIIGYPFAFTIARSKSRHRALLLLLVMIPFWTSSLIRTYAIMALIKAKGILNTVLLAIGLIHHPLPILYSYSAVLLGCVYDLLPFMILPLYGNIEKLNPDLLEAAQDLGAGKIRTMVKVVFPLTMPGIIAGTLLVFLPAMTMFYIPVLLGGAKNLLLGNLIENQFLSANNWPMGAAISMLITVFMGAMILLYWRNAQSKDKQNLQELV